MRPTRSFKIRDFPDPFSPISTKVDPFSTPNDKSANRIFFPIAFPTDLNVIELVSKIKNHFNNLKLIIKKNKLILEKEYLNLDIKRSVKLLRLKNNISLNERIERTANLYKQILNSKNINHMEQIYKKEILNFLSK